MTSENRNNNYPLKFFVESSLLRNILFTVGTIVLFFSGMIVYGIILNLREIPLKEAMAQKGFAKLEDVNLVVNRKSYNLNLYEDTVLVKSYRASFGRNLLDKKKRADDGATPVGEYKICSIENDSVYYKFLKLNYPNLEDAVDALRKSLITQKEFNEIKFQFYYEDCIDANTALGGDIGIHGLGRLNAIFKNLPFVYNWTDGSIALSNENLDEILTVIHRGTKVVIK
ncbi:MAG: L,D-transpeptidase [Ignavibacteriaceae bacterium]